MKPLKITYKYWRTEKDYDTRPAIPTPRLIDSPELAHRLAENGNQKVRSQYSWQVIASQFHNLYQGILDRKGDAWQV